MATAPFHGAIPDGLLYDPGLDMWVRREGEEALVGATAFGIHRAGEVIGFTAKPRGADVERGRGMATVECAKTVLAVRAPISFLLVEANEHVEEHPLILNRDPYGAGWMARCRPTAWDAEAVHLVDAGAYRAHVLRLEPGAVIE